MTRGTATRSVDTADVAPVKDGSVDLAVEVEGAKRRFGDVVALDGATLSVPKGSIVALLGPSGCGKTTLLRAVAGFERLDEGEIKVDGRVVSGAGTHLPPERRGVGIVPQEQALFPHLSVTDNVGFGLRRPRRSHGGTERQPRIEAMLELAGLQGLGRRMPHELSGGQQQRVALARALAPSPAVVLLDEPFASLDATLRVSLRAEVRRILRQSAATAVLVTHDQEEALSTADLVAVMRAGRVVQVGSPDDVYRRPADAWIASFVGDANILDGVLDGNLVQSPLGLLNAARPSDAGTSHPGGPVEVVVRPEQLGVKPVDAEAPSDDGDAVVAVVVDHQYFGHDALVSLRLLDGTTLVARAQARDLAAPGSAVTIRCRGEVTCFPRG